MDEQENVNLDTTNETVEETVETPTDTEGDTVETPEVDVDQLQATNKKLYERAKKAEADLKALKGTSHVNNDPFFEERLELLASGLSREEVDKAKVIAIGNKTTLAEALKDDMFIAYQSKIKEDKRKEAAKLGASKGSGESQDNTLIKPDMTRDEHVEAFNKVMGR